jgi:hypothetical protein
MAGFCGNGDIAHRWKINGIYYIFYDCSMGSLDFNHNY